MTGAQDFEEFFGSLNRSGVEYIDILTAIDGVSFDEAWARKVASQYGQQQIWLISKEDPIRNKRASGRKQDLLDLESLT